MDNQPCKTSFDRIYMMLEDSWRSKVKEELIEIEKSRCFSIKEQELFNRILTEKK